MVGIPRVAFAVCNQESYLCCAVRMNYIHVALLTQEENQVEYVVWKEPIFNKREMKKTKI